MFGVTEIVGDHVYSVIIFNLINPQFFINNNNNRGKPAAIVYWSGRG